jgi:serine/threonine-protein kinase RsbW
VTQLSFTLPPAAPSAAQARERLRNVMGAWADEDTRDDAQLLLTEVVANGVIHARSTLGIQLTVEHNLLRAEVSDDCPQTPILRQPDDTGGRGLLILSRVASRWGVLRHPGDGKTVWFELADATHLAGSELVGADILGQSRSSGDPRDQASMSLTSPGSTFRAPSCGASPGAHPQLSYPRNP